MESSNLSERLKKFIDFLGPSAKSGEIFEWWIFPSVERPRVMIPTDPLFWTKGLAFISSPTKRFGLRVLLVGRHLIRKKADFKFRGPLPQSLTKELGAKSTDLAHLAVYVATPNRFSKYTLTLLNKEGDALGFAKVAEGKDAEQAIKNEVVALNFLAKEFPDSISFPRVICHQAKGLAIQSSAPDAGHGKLAENAGRIAGQIFRSLVREVNWGESESRRELVESANEVNAAGRNDLGRLLLEIEILVGEKFGNNLIREGLTHGDFVAWNMADCPEGFIFDWEWMGQRAEYHDLFHFLWFRDLQKKKTSQMAHLISRWKSQEARQLLVGYGSDEDGPLSLHALLYLANSFAFYSRHSVANDDDPLAFPFMIAILDNLRAFAERESHALCTSPALFRLKEPTP